MTVMTPIAGSRGRPNYVQTDLVLVNENSTDAEIHILPENYVSFEFVCAF